MSLEEKLISTLKSLLSSNFTGLDPGSFYSNNFRKYIFKRNSGLRRIWNSLFLRLSPFFGDFLILFFKLQKISSTKAISLTLLGLKNLHDKNILNSIDHESIINELIKVLLNKRCLKINAWCPDFDYTINSNFIPKSSIGVINTVFSCEAIWQLRDKIPNYEKVIISTAHSCYSLLPIYEDSNVRCFSYNQNTQYYVHNSNLFITLLLLRANEIDNSLFNYKTILKHIYYFINDFKKNNIIRYAGEPTVSNTVDNYHTGFVLRTLYDINKLIPNKFQYIKHDIEDILIKGLNYYKVNFIKNHGIPKFPNNIFSVNAHSTAEACLILDKFKSYLTTKDINEMKISIFKSQEALWCEYKNHFISDVFVYKKFNFSKNKLFMPRWSLAWMFYGLSAILSL